MVADLVEHLPGVLVELAVDGQEELALEILDGSLGRSAKEVVADLLVAHVVAEPVETVLRLVDVGSAVAVDERQPSREGGGRGRAHACPQGQGSEERRDEGDAAVHVTPGESCRLVAHGSADQGRIGG